MKMKYKKMCVTHDNESKKRSCIAQEWIRVVRSILKWSLAYTYCKTYIALLFFFFSFHHQLNPIWRSIMVSSGFSPLSITVVGIELWFSLPNSALIITEPTNDLCLSFFEFFFLYYKTRINSYIHISF
jgi:hypothetical protein